MKINFDMQIYPIAHIKEKEKYIINNYQELIQQLRSLKEDAKINAMGPLHEEVFYKDYNALKIILDLLLD